MSVVTPTFKELEIEIITHSEVASYDVNLNHVAFYPSSLAKLSDRSGREAVFRMTKEESNHNVVLTLCYSTFGGGSSLMEGRSINFTEGAGLVYYHLLMVSCDPRGERKKAMVKHEIDIPEALSECLDFERHEVIYGSKTSRGNGFCVLVEKDDINTMCKVYFFEKMAPLLNLKPTRSKSKKH